jgi:uncharacterized membrane protein YccF (DUF307 family)
VTARVALNEAKSKPVPLLNLLWIIFGALWMAAGWMLADIVMVITIIGLPWARTV